MARKKQIEVKEIIKQHVSNNIKEYSMVALIFIIGIFLGVLFVNNIQEGQKAEISTYLTNFMKQLKETENLNQVELFKNSISQNMILAVIIWFFGTTVIGIPVVFGMVLYRGFCLGYTISVCISTMGLSKGFVFVLTSLVPQNIIFIPVVLALAVSGFKLYKSIMKDKRRENIKLEVIRHIVFSIIMVLLLFVSSAVEIFISTNILKIIAKYF